MKQRKKGGELALQFIAVIHELAKPCGSEEWMPLRISQKRSTVGFQEGNQASLAEQLGFAGFNCYFRIDRIAVHVKCVVNPHHFKRDTLTM